MKWILQKNIWNEFKFDQLIETLNRFNIDYSIHKVIPFIGKLEPDCERDINAICFGSYSMRHTAKENNLYPGVFDLEPFTFIEQLAHWKDQMLNHDAIVEKFGQVQFPDQNMFIRPIEDSKSFSGQIMNKDTFEKWRNNVRKNVTAVDYSTVTFDSIIQLCELKKIISEYRTWVVDGKIVTASLYKRGPTVVYSDKVDQHIIDYAQSIVDQWSPLRAFVLDVCEVEINDKVEMKVVEINTINSSGFYHGDVQKLVFALQDSFSLKQKT